MTQEIFRKSLRFVDGDFKYEDMLNLFRKSPDALIKWLEVTMGQSGKAGVQELSYKLLHMVSGTQFIVQKELSDELQLTDFENAHFEALSWPAPSVEFYFEDPKLPTIIVCHSPHRGFVYDLCAQLYGPEFEMPGIGEAREPCLGAICDNAATLTSCTVLHNFQTWDQALETGRCEIELDNGNPPSGLHQTRTESEVMHGMLNLSLKVLAYSAIPHYRPQPVTRKQMGRGPKPGVNGRPQRPAFRTVYLPRIVRPSAPAGEGTSKSREFKGRRGHLRHLRSEWYKEKRGQWIYVAPVHVEGVVPTIYKVRKA